jgi:hypothetical protein
VIAGHQDIHIPLHHLLVFSSLHSRLPRVAHLIPLPTTRTHCALGQARGDCQQLLAADKHGAADSKAHCLSRTGCKLRCLIQETAARADIPIIAFSRTRTRRNRRGSLSGLRIVCVCVCRVCALAVGLSLNRYHTTPSRRSAQAAPAPPEAQHKASPAEPRLVYSLEFSKRHKCLSIHVSSLKPERITRRQIALVPSASVTLPSYLNSWNATHYI